MTILTEIIDFKRTFEIPRRMKEIPLEKLQAIAVELLPALDFKAAIGNKLTVSLIAEIKRASPSKGLLHRDFNPLQLAKTYAENGASAISILTDEKYFQGSLDHLHMVRKKYPTIPLLRKDFIIHPYQIFEARASGADAILLIAAVLPTEEIKNLYSLCKSLGLEALIEIHNRDELEKVLPMDPMIIGMNNRNLHDFSINIQTCITLRGLVPAGITTVAESGITTAEDVLSLVKAGFDAMLVGEALITSASPEDKIKELIHAGQG